MNGEKLYKNLIERMVSPALLLIFLLLLGLVIAARPAVFQPIYASLLKDKPAMIHDGKLIAAGLASEESYESINEKLNNGRMGPREIYHFEDVREKIKLARVVAGLSLGALVLLIYFCRLRLRKIVGSTLIWYGAIAVIAAVWASIKFRHFFRSLHWWIFQDDSWILPNGCYSLKLYPYVVWQVFGGMVLGGVLLALFIGYLGLRRTAR